MQPITLLTDFGTTDAYAGVVKGVILSRAPNAQIVDLTHAADSGSAHAGGHLLTAISSYFPSGTVHFVLTGLGSASAGMLAAAANGQFLVAPDNGVAGLFLDEYAPSHVVRIENPPFILPPRRSVFHSRIIYAPAAAALASGDVRVEELGTTLASWKRLPNTLAQRQSDGSLDGQVVHVDHFGNLVTNIRAYQLPAKPRICIGSHIIDRVSANYSDVAAGSLLAIIGSTGNLEISINRGNAAKQLYASVSTKVCIEPADRFVAFGDGANLACCGRRPAWWSSFKVRGMLRGDCFAGSGQA